MSSSSAVRDAWNAHQGHNERVRPVAELNALREPDFGVALRPLFEAADPLARALYAQRPFASYDDLLGRAERIAQRLPPAEQIQVLNAHPRIGERPEAVSALSYREQGYDSEARLPSGELRRVYADLAELNEAYERQFGFRFVVFVNKRPKSAILDVLRQRLDNAREVELQTGLRELFLIARDRYAAST
jgi:2-oxo-4-hydroxy-4-carboxy--5-ureidoimidazoline (OHCU) decarboxylase